jgi:MFS transporter, SP family, major inositol transporter
VFPQLVQAAGASATFALFVLINLLSIYFVAKCVPETRGRTLEELEDEFRASGGRVVAHSAPPVGLAGAHIS